MNGQFKIPEVDFKALSWDDFSREYFEPEAPLLIRNVETHSDNLRGVTSELIHDGLVKKGLVNRSTYWYEGRGSELEDYFEIPKLVSNSLRRSFVRERFCRIWTSRAGQVTPWHYDGNFVYVFNLQVKGKKHWRIVSPETPVSAYPFRRIARLIDDAELIGPSRLSAEFELNEGDMVFLPPLWFHKVTSIGTENINVNWVATKQDDHKRSELFHREIELLKLGRLFSRVAGRRRVVDKFLGEGVDGYLENFAGVGFKFVESITSEVSNARALGRFAKEAMAAPFVYIDRRNIKTTRAAFKQV